MIDQSLQSAFFVIGAQKVFVSMFPSIHKEKPIIQQETTSTRTAIC